MHGIASSWTQWRRIALRFSGVALLASSLSAQSDPPVAAGPVRLQIHPARIQLHHAEDLARVIASAQFEDGLQCDVTRDVHWQIDPPHIARLRADHVLLPLSNGHATLSATWNGVHASAQIQIEHAEDRQPLSFQRDILPTLTKAGCNAGGCHGSAAGKNGFRLSLFAYDPERDYERLTRELFARRVDLANPSASLLLTKPLGAVPHQGGQIFDRHSNAYATLARWIEEGARGDVTSPAALAKLELLPSAITLDGAEREHALIALAHYADGTQRDVTELSLFSSSNDSIARIEGNAQVISGQRGAAHILARFGTLATTSQVLVLPSGAPASQVAANDSNIVDQAIAATLQRLRWDASGRCSDEQFIRRIYLDTIAVLPRPEEVRAFLADEDPARRSKLIDQLLARREFALVTASSWAEVLRFETGALEEKGVYLAVEWLTEAIHEGRPIDAIVRELLTAEGSHFEVPAAAYWVADTDPKVVAENTAQALLGIRLQCAQCHNHPFDRWTMDDYYGFAAFFAQVGRKRGLDPRERVIFNARAGGVRHARDGKDVAPRLLGAAGASTTDGLDRRAIVAAWITAKENPWFARNVANRLWARFFGRGLVEPLDDVRVSNPPSHPQLLDALAEHLRNHDFDLRATARLIANSDAYQRDLPVQAAPAEAFAGAAVRRLPAEALLDAIDQVTGVPSEHEGTPQGGRAIDLVLARARHPFLELFGRPARESACTCERRDEPTLGQALHLVNGATIAEKIAHPDGRLQRALKAKLEPTMILDELWLAAYARHPTPHERQRALSEINTASDPQAAWEDLLWALLNSREFLFQH